MATRTVDLNVYYWGYSAQNHRQEVFNSGLDTENLIKTPVIYSVSYFNLGGLALLFGGLSPPCRRD